MPTVLLNGSSLYYRESGRLDAPLLVILPGNTASSACHDGELAHFGKRFHVVALDLPGTGRSDRMPEWPANWWAFGATAAAALIERLGAGPAVLVGCSGGAVVALLLAAARPELVRAVVADSGVGRLAPAALRREVANRARRTPEQVRFWRHANGEDWASVVDADSTFLLGLAARGGDAIGDRLSLVRCPVLLTGSTRDDLVPDLPTRLLWAVGDLADARAHVVGAGGHPLMWSRPTEFRAAADSFLEGVLTDE